MFKNIYYDSWNNKMHLWEIGEDGKTVYNVFKHEIEYYVLDKTGKSPIKDIFGNSVVRKVTDSRKNLKDLKDSGEKLFESDLSEEVKFLHKRYGDQEHIVNIKDYSIFNIDIETEYPESETINLVGLEDFHTGEIFQLGLKPYTGDNKETKYIHCDSESVLLERLCKFLHLKHVNVLIGWNLTKYDIPKIQERIDALNLKCCLSSIGKIIRKYDGEIVIPGIDILDCMDIYKKFTAKSQPSFSLNYIGMLEVNEGKLEYEGTINDFWKADWNRFVDYNFQDLRLVKKIDDKKKFIKLAIDLCTHTRTPFSKISSTIAVIEGYILRHMHKNNIVMSDISHDIKSEQERSIKGGWVETEPGFYLNSLSIDATALYPHIIMMFNISTETKVINPKEEEIPNLIKTQFPGVYYRKNVKGILPIVVKKLYDDRKALKDAGKNAKKEKDLVKAEFYNSQQAIIKILANGVFGSCLEAHFHFYDFDNGSVITAVGREAIVHVKTKFDEYIKKDFKKLADEIYPNNTFNPTKIKKSLSVLCDTDSRFFDLSYLYSSLAPEKSFLEFSLDFQKKVLEPFLKVIMEEFAEKYNTKNLIHFKREKIIAKIYVQQKKKYATLNLANEEEIYETPDFAITGLEIKKSDLCMFSRKNLEQLLHIMFAGKIDELPNRENMLTHIRKAYKEFKSQKISDISAPKGINDYDKYSVEGFTNFNKGTPIYNRASIIYNHVVEDNNLQLTKIVNGTKMKYIYVNPNNKYKTNAIGYIGNWPAAFDKLFQIDYETQFEKQYLAPAQRMFDTLKFGTITLKDSKLLKMIEDD